MLLGKQDLRRIKTREKLYEAYLKLLTKKTPDTITILELTSLANINRVTFYKQFRNLANFQYMFIEHYILSIYEFMKPLNYKPYSQGFEYEALVQLLTYIKDNADVYKVLLTSPNAHDFNRQLFSFFQKKITKHTDELAYFDFPGTGVNQEIVAWYGVSALFGTMMMWVQADFPYSPEQLAKSFVKLSPNPN